MSTNLQVPQAQSGMFQPQLLRFPSPPFPLHNLNPRRPDGETRYSAHRPIALVIHVVYIAISTSFHLQSIVSDSNVAPKQPRQCDQLSSPARETSRNHVWSRDVLRLFFRLVAELPLWKNLWILDDTLLAALSYCHAPSRRVPKSQGRLTSSGHMAQGQE
jgi:hypothetical protein